jgi:ElaB/YqjD/DUF883 family membrane-anchored ribosome-binding protein
VKEYLDDYDIDFDIPRSVKRQIEKDYIQRTYYWTVGLGCLIIGFLLGVLV